MRRTSCWLRWGFCSIRGALTACRRRVGALDGAIPPVWWWRGRCLRWRGAQNADHLEQSTPNSPIFTEVVCVLGSSRGGWVARARCRAPRRGGSDPTATLCVRTLTPECARKPLDTHVNPSTCTWAALPTRISSGPRATCRAHVPLQGPTCDFKGPRAH